MQSGKSIAGESVASPAAMLLAGCIMLDYLWLLSCVSSTRSAVLMSVENKEVRTPDIGGQGSTLDAINHIVSHIRKVN